ncbi:hypothetical protein BDZ45DRAFT_728559 [Acephala macrosclerotiorum]|nr:hypothetical protein BDZ45DRAFT_728559 [Acephala macrosclerotiorum]
MSTTDNILQWFRLLNGNTSNTSDIFFAGFGAIIASTFLTLHLNVPPSQLGSKLRGLYLLRRQALWGLMVVVAPELLVSIAFGDWRAAHIGAKILRELDSGNVTEWTKMHASFANMSGIVFQMQKEGSEIPDSAPYKDEGGIAKLEQIFDKMRKPTLKQVEDISKVLMLKLKIWSMVRWVRFLLLFLMRFARAAMRTIYKYGISRIKSRPKHASNDETVELEDSQNLSSSFKARMRPAKSNGNVQVGQESDNIRLARSDGSLQIVKEGANSGEDDKEPFQNRPSSLDLGHFGHTLSTNPEVFEPVMTSAVLASDDNHISHDSNMDLPEEESTDLGIVDITSVRVDEQEISNPDDTAQVLPQTSIQLHLNSMQIAAAQVLGILGDRPEITLEDIEARSKVTVSAKAVAIITLLWFSLKIIIQVSRGYAISQLELASVTYILCALFSYILFWSKPQAVEIPIKHIVHVSDTIRSVTDQNINILRSFGGSPFLIRNFVSPFGMGYRGHEPTMPIPTDISLTTFALFGPEGKKVFFGDSDFSGVVVGMIFGGLYCLGWNDPFPSIWEQWAWRLCALVITASLIPYSVANKVCTTRFQHLFDDNSTAKTHIMHVIVLYCLLDSMLE